MKYRCRLLIMASAVFCLSLAAVAPAADSCVKTLYIDGAYVDDANTGQGLTWPYERITIGAENNRWWPYNEYIGKMDEFAIYAGVLDAGRIAAHYSAKDSNTAYVAAVQVDNPLLWLRFEDANTLHESTAANSGSIGIDGTYSSISGIGASITQTTGIATGSTAIVFPGAEPDANGHTVDVWDGNGDFGEDLDGDVTVELWVNFTAIGSMTDNDYPRFFQHNSGGQGGYGVMVSSPNQVGIQGGDATNYMYLPYDINDGQWHHVVVTYDSTYIPAPTEPNTYVEAVMADNPALYLRFEEDDPCDYSGNNYWVDYSDTVTIEKTPGSMGNCAHLNAGWIAAANQQAEPCLPTDYNHAYAFSPNDLSVEFWLYTPDPNLEDMYVTLFTQLEDELYYAPKAQRAGEGGRIAFADSRVPNGGGYAYTWGGGWNNTDTNWHHYVIIWDEQTDVNGTPTAMRVLWYADGVNYKDSTYAAPGTSLGYIGPEMDHILIGREGSRDNPGPSWNAYRQYMDEFAIYPYVLTPDQIDNHITAWEPKDCNELWDREMAEPWAVAVDKNKDCIVNLTDYAHIGLEWLFCNDPCDANFVPNW